MRKVLAVVVIASAVFVVSLRIFTASAARASGTSAAHPERRPEGPDRSPAHPERGPEGPESKDPQLLRALAEARANVEAARALAAGAPRVLLRTDELELALRLSPELARDEREHLRLVLVSRLVHALAEALARGDLSRLEEERLTEEDFRFLLGAIESRLSKTVAREPMSRPASYVQKRLRQFRGLSFEEGLRSLFE